MAERTCTVYGCERRHYAKGLCTMHYARWRKHGDPHRVDKPKMIGTPEERFWPKVDRHGPIPDHQPQLGPCWLWVAHRDRKGYGRLGVLSNRAYLAHRFSYELLVGPIPDGLSLDHLCRVPSCRREVIDAGVRDSENRKRRGNP